MLTVLRGYSSTASNLITAAVEADLSGAIQRVLVRAACSRCDYVDASGRGDLVRR